MKKIYNQNYRLALDINTSAIGIATYKLEKDKNKLVPTELTHIDVRVFGEPIADAKTGTLKKSVRREKRLIRRQIQRYRQRLKKIAHLFSLVGEDSDSVRAVQGDDVHEWRAKGVSEKITVAQLMAVYMLMAKNRGYQGALKKDDGVVQKHIDELSTLLKENNYKTIGQLLYKNKQSSVEDEVILPWKKISESGTYAEREMLKDEFMKLWEEQKKHHPILSEKAEDNEHIRTTYTKYYQNIDSIESRKKVEGITVKDLFYMALFDQRPIWWDVDTFKVERAYRVIL